jgi:ankyrin repeat protein
MPTRPLPSNASEQSVKDDARRLLRDHEGRDPAALQRLREFLPRLHDADDDAITLATLKWNDALFAIAREYGFDTWPKLKAHLEGERSTIARPLHEQIEDELFRRAADLMDQGDEAALAAHLAAHPDLARERVHFEGLNYFRNPSLLAFIAENPVRHGRMPSNVVEVACVVLDAGAAGDKKGLDETLALVSSGRVARECRAQEALIKLLCDRGADPGQASQPALSHGEFEAAFALLRCGAPLTLSVSAALGMTEEAQKLLPNAEVSERHLALANAAQHGRAAIIRLLLDAGGDPSRYNPEGAHSHSTPLHQAAWHGHDEVARLLVECGARRDVRDTVFRATPADWAEHSGHAELAAWLRSH